MDGQQGGTCDFSLNPELHFSWLLRARWQRKNGARPPHPVKLEAWKHACNYTHKLFVCVRNILACSIVPVSHHTRTNLVMTMQGKRILVTGGSAGLGAAVVRSISFHDNSIYGPQTCRFLYVGWTSCCKRCNLRHQFRFG